MILNISINPNEIKYIQRMQVNTDSFLPYTAAYIDAGTYCTNVRLDNGIEFSAPHNSLHHNLHMGKFNSLADNIECVFGRNHNYKKINTGALDLFFQGNQISVADSDTDFTQKGTIIIQNDVWIGSNVTIMPGVVIRNGAVIARNSHVVSDVPPYAIVGGNPAKIIGYRFSPKQIEKLQKIAWWNWDTSKLLDNAHSFSYDIDLFCDEFYPTAEEEYKKLIQERDDQTDTYFCFVDYYENYSCFSFVLEAFLDKFIGDSHKKLILYIQEQEHIPPINPQVYNSLNSVVDELTKDINIKCSIEIQKGSKEDTVSSFINASHYIVSRTYDTVYFSCLADLLGIDVISGVDSKIAF